MAISLSKQTAQKIVDAVKDVCGFDINFINNKGIVFASTDESRIGDFHEIGKKVIETQQTVEVQADNRFYGTHKGVNIPFIYNGEAIAVIGISGNPDDVRQYAILAQKITSLILREQETDSLNYGRKNQVNYIIRALTGNAEINHHYLLEFLSGYNLTLEMPCRTILIKLNARYHIANLSFIENHIYQIFDQIPAAIYTFNFPNEYVLILPDEQYQKCHSIFDTLATNYKQIISIGIGHQCLLKKQAKSYDAAQIALNSLSGETNIALFDNLDLEILLSCVTKNAKEKYLQKTISKLDPEDLQLLKIYFSTDMSLKNTSEILFLHKNTLQYKLNRIETLSGYNPRHFRDAVTLYLALKL